MLVDVSIKDFAKKVASYESVVPAGGSVMALSGLMGVCLVEMSVDSVFGRQEEESNDVFFKNTKTQLTQLHSELLTYIEKDTEAYDGVLNACKLGRTNQKEADHRKAEIQAAALSAIEIPLKISEACLAALETGIMLLPKVKRCVQGDLKIGLLVIKAGIEGSLAAAKINLSLIYDDTLSKAFQTRIDELKTKFDAVLKMLCCLSD